MNYTNKDERAVNPVLYDLGMTINYDKVDVSSTRQVVYENHTDNIDQAETIYVARSTVPQVSTNFVKATYTIPPTNCVRYIIGIEELKRVRDSQDNMWDIPMRAYTTFIHPLSGFVTAQDLDELAKRHISSWPTFSDGSFNLMKIARGSLSF